MNFHVFILSVSQVSCGIQLFIKYLQWVFGKLKLQQKRFYFHKYRKSKHIFSRFISLKYHISYLYTIKKFLDSVLVLQDKVNTEERRPSWTRLCAQY